MALVTTAETSPSREVVKRQASAAFDRAFQNLFTLGFEVVALYRQREAIDGSAADLNPRLTEVPPHVVEENLRAYKNCFDSTGPAIHVDTVLELYAKVRTSLHRGYQCNSWLTNGPVALYYGETLEKAGSRIVHLDCLFLMLESLRRADTTFRTSAAVMRIRFAVLLYTVFMTSLRYSSVVEGEVNVRGVTPTVSIADDLSVMETLHSDCVGDLPKPERPAGPAAAAGGNPLMAGLAGMFPGGLGDIVNSLLTTLPDITRTVTETVARTTGTAITAHDQEMIDSTMGNITEMLRNPDGMRSMLGELGNGSAGISSFVQRILSRPPGSATPAVAAAVEEAPPAPSAGGDKLD